MTAKTSQHLADTLRAAGFEDLAKRAEADEFHDFLSEHAFPEMQLDAELFALMGSISVNENQRLAAAAIRGRHHNGEFDASVEESDEWAESPEGQAIYNALMEGK